MVGNGRELTGLERAVDGRADQVVVFVVFDAIPVAPLRVPLRTRKPVAMLSWPRGMTERPRAIAKICRPKTRLVGKPETCEKLTSRLRAPTAG
jgi:hypothetical protein